MTQFFVVEAMSFCIQRLFVLGLIESTLCS